MADTNNWIEEAERKQNAFADEQEHKKIIQQVNIEENFKVFYIFVKSISNLIERVNNLAWEARKPSLELGMTEVEEHKCYEFYGSAYIYKKTFFSFFTGTRSKHLCWRRISFKISDHRNIIKVHISEMFSEKNIGTQSGNNERKEKYKLKLSGFNDKFEYNTINWLTFNLSNHDFKKQLPFADQSDDHLM